MAAGIQWTDLAGCAVDPKLPGQVSPVVSEWLLIGFRVHLLRGMKRRGGLPMPKRKREKPTSRKDSRNRSPDSPTGARSKRLMIAASVPVTLVIGLSAVLLCLPSRDGSPTRREDESLAIPDRPVFGIRSDPTPVEIRVAALREESFDVSEQIVKDLPESPHAWWLLGQVHYRHANEATAAQLWQTCLRMDPQFADAHFSFGMAALKKGDFATAERWLSRALQSDPTWGEVPAPLAQAMLAQGKVDEAISVLESFLRTQPESSEAWCRIGQAQQQAGNHAQAKQSYLKAIALSPESAEAHYGAAMAFQRLGRPDEARKHLDEFGRFGAQQDADFLEMRAGLNDTDRMRGAVINTLVTAGELYALHGRLENAEACWKRAADLDEEHRRSREMLSVLYARQQRLDEAMQLRKELCRLAPERSDYWLSLGRLCVRCGRPSEAEAPLRRVIELAPRRPEGYVALAEIHMLPGRDPHRAVELARKAVDLSPTASHYSILAAAYSAVGDRASGREAAEMAVRLERAAPRSQEAYTVFPDSPSE